MAHFDRIILATVLALGLVIAVLSVASARFGPAVDTMRTAQTIDGTAINTQVSVTFTDHMDQRSVEKSFSISPHVAGDFNWSGNALLFSPRRSLAYGAAYTITIGSGARDTEGKGLFHPFKSTFTTQRPHLVYRGSRGSERNRLVLASVTGRRRILGSDDGSVTDYSVSFDRSLAVYVRRGSKAERPDEIWLLSLTDGTSRRVFRKAKWALSDPRLSPDGRYIAFLATNVVLCRKYYGCYTDRTSPVIYLLDLRSRKAQTFKHASDVPITNFLEFSPAGQLAYTDLGSALTLSDVAGKQVSHVPNEGNSLEFIEFDEPGDKAAFVGQTPDSSGGDILVYRRGGYIDVSRHVYDSSTPAFATSGKQIAYAAYRGEKGIEPIYGINVYDFSSRATRKLTAEHEWSDWTPQWSPDDRYIAFVRSRPQEAMYMGSGAIWVMGADGTRAHPLDGVGRDIHWAL